MVDKKFVCSFGILLTGLLFGGIVHSVQAQSLDWSGWSLAVSNDSIGEGRDRWQSSSVQLGLLFTGPHIDVGSTHVGQSIEVRFGSDILTPESLDRVNLQDRRYVSTLAFGLHSHSSWPGADVRLGADLVVIGPQTGVYSFQQDLHKILGFTRPQLEEFQIDDAIFLDFSGEVASAYPVGSTRVRPFIEAKSGTETLFRLGADVAWGIALDDRAMRATVTGQRVPFEFTEEEGINFSVGGDVAWVDESADLPKNLGYELNNPRMRVRAGVRHVNTLWDTFYGIVWLNEEFRAQHEGQFVGTFQFKFRF